MSIFCDYHEWVGEQGQSCPECDALWAAAFPHKGTTQGPSQGSAAPVINNLPKQPLLGGINVTMSEALPRKSMVVSKDIFEMLRGKLL